MSPGAPPHRFLTLVRHAQAGPAAPGTSDAARTLSARGRRDADALAARLARASPEGVPPIDRVLCSGARRTRETLARLAPSLGAAGADAAFDDALYLASADTIERHARDAFAAGARHVMIVGHNPGLERSCARLVGEPALGMAPCTRFVLRLTDPADGARPPAGTGTVIGGAAIAVRDVPGD